MSTDQQLISRLCQAKNPRDFLNWEDHQGYYAATCRVSREDVPGLIEIVRHWSDPNWLPDTTGLDVPKATAEMLPVTAWRTLADLQATEAVEPLIDVICACGDEFDDWVFEELPEILGEFGELAIEPLMILAKDQTRKEFARSAAVHALRFVVKYHPEFRETVLRCLTQLMENAAQETNEFNTSLLCELMDLKAIESAAAIEHAYSLDCIDTWMCGDWEEVRKELGVVGLGLPMPVRRDNRLQPLSPDWHIADLEDFTEQFDEDEFASPGAAPTFLTRVESALVSHKTVGRNDPCPCNSGKKYKKCCGRLV